MATAQPLRRSWKARNVHSETTSETSENSDSYCTACQEEMESQKRRHGQLRNDCNYKWIPHNPSGGAGDPQTSKGVASSARLKIQMATAQPLCRTKRSENAHRDASEGAGRTKTLMEMPPLATPHHTAPQHNTWLVIFVEAHRS